MAFSDTYTVEVNDCRYTQNMQSNMIWNYDLNLTAVAPGNIGSLNSLNKAVYDVIKFNSVQSVLNDTYNVGKTLLSQILL